MWIFRVQKQKETAITEVCKEINEHIHSKVFQTPSHKLTWCWNCVSATAVWQDEEAGGFFWGLLRWSSRLHLATIHSAVSFVCTSLWLRLFESADRPPTPSGFLPCWRGLESQCVRNKFQYKRSRQHSCFLISCHISPITSPGSSLSTHSNSKDVESLFLFFLFFNHKFEFLF